jgi:hypothetical protein
LYSNKCLTKKYQFGNIFALSLKDIPVGYPFGYLIQGYGNESLFMNAENSFEKNV